MLITILYNNFMLENSPKFLLHIWLLIVCLQYLLVTKPNIISDKSWQAVPPWLSCFHTLGLPLQVRNRMAIAKKLGPCDSYLHTLLVNKQTCILVYLPTCIVGFLVICLLVYTKKVIWHFETFWLERDREREREVYYAVMKF